MKGKTDCMYCNGTGRAVPFFRANASADGRVACSCIKKVETAEPMKSMEYKPLEIEDSDDSLLINIAMGEELNAEFGEKMAEFFDGGND